MADNIQHEDFGEKIGGAKKDLWKDRGLYVNDLDAMNEREAEKFVKKDNIWKKPDYGAMLEDGVPPCKTERIYPDGTGAAERGLGSPHRGGCHESL